MITINDADSYLVKSLHKLRDIKPKETSSRVCLSSLVPVVIQPSSTKIKGVQYCSTFKKKTKKNVLTSTLINDASVMCRKNLSVIRHSGKDTRNTRKHVKSTKLDLRNILPVDGIDAEIYRSMVHSGYVCGDYKFWIV